MAVVTGVGSGYPPQVVANDAFEPIGLTDRWISTRTGIRQRRRLRPDESLTDLAVDASRAAMADAGRVAADIDLVLAATLTPDRPSPALAVEMAARLGAAGPGAVDLNGACSGFLFALDYAVARIDAGTARCVLVCGADATSRILDAKDPASAPLFGDGAGAVLVEPGTCGRGCRSRVLLRTDGRQRDVLHVDAAERLLRMDGTEVYRQAIEAMASSVREICADAAISVDDIDLFVPHQANIRIIKQVARDLGLSEDRAAVYLADTGNTSAASIPGALDRAQKAGRLWPGSRVALTAFGAGTSWGAALIDWRGCRHVRPAARPAGGNSSVPM